MAIAKSAVVSYHAKETISHAPPPPPAVKKETLTREELACALRALVYGSSNTGTGHHCNVVDEGVYCQFNRPGVDGGYHVTVTVPETFDLVTISA